VNIARSAFYATLVLLAGATAAVFAHVAIDLSGDVLLARDTYDGVDHHSRALFVGIALVLAAIFALRFIAEALGRRSSSLLPKTCGAGFVALVVLTSIGLLAGMEAYDALASGVRIDGLEDLLGGSFVLGASCTIAIGTFVALLVRSLVSALTAWEPAIAAFFVRLLVARTQRSQSRRVGRDCQPAKLNYAYLCTRSGGNRAPPFSTPAFI
jgi:hypothetical protein